MAEIVLEVVALGFQDIEPFILDLPASPATSGELGDVVTLDRQIGDEAVAIGPPASRISIISQLTAIASASPRNGTSRSH